MNFISLTIVCLLFSATVLAEESLLPTPASANISDSGAWCWFADPRAIHYHHVTYVSFIDTYGNITVTAYDHKKDSWTAYTVFQHMKKDDHSNPSLMIRPDKHIMVFWSPHGGRPMYYRRSAHPLNIMEWEEVKEIHTNVKGHYGFTYPNPVSLSAENDTIYLFWRGGNYNPTYARLESHAKHWTEAKQLVLVPKERPYMKVRGNDKDTIHFAFTEAHPRNWKTSIYHMYYRSGHLYRTDGTLIGPMGTAVTPQEATLVYNSNATDENIRAWIHDLGIDRETGHPVVTFAAIYNCTHICEGHRYHYARWNGKEWVDRDLVYAGHSISENPGEPHYTAGITLDPENVNVVHLARDVKGNNIMEIERWTTGDKGVDWQVETITRDSHEQNVRPYKPRGMPSNTTALSMLWMAGRYPFYTQFETRIKYLV